MPEVKLRETICPHCGLWEKDGHVCPPEWQVALDDGELIGTIHADDAESAAEEWRKSDVDDWDFDDSYVLAVRQVDTKEWKFFSTHRFQHVSFSASELAAAPKDWIEPEGDTDDQES